MMTSLANPWAGCDADRIETELGFRFGLPEGAENAVYFWSAALQCGELRYQLDGADWTARAQKAEAFTDISGMYYSWEPGCFGLGDELMLHGLTGTQRMARSQDHVVQSALWYHEQAGLMLSLACTAGANPVPFHAEDVFPAF